MRIRRIALVVPALVLLIALLSGAQFEAHATWTVDSKNRAVHDGNAVFLRLAYDSLFDVDGAANHVATRHLENYGFNIYLHYMFGSFENALLQLPALPPGVFGMATGNATGPYTVWEMGLQDGVQRFDLVNNPNNFRARFNAEPRAGGVYLADEPDVSVLSDIQQWAITYKNSLPDMPRLVVLFPEGPLIPKCCHPSDPQYGDEDYQERTTSAGNVYYWASRGAGGDWLAQDPYPGYKPESEHAPWGYPHFIIADRTAQSVAAATQNGQVPMTILQLFRFGGGRFPTPDEMWSQMVMVVAEGARGIGWWKLGRFGDPDANGQTHDGFADQPDSIRIPADNALKDMTHLLALLEPIILSDPNPPLLVGNSTSTGDPLAWRLGVLPTVAEAVSVYSYGAGGRGAYVAEKNALLDGERRWSPMLDLQSGDVRTRVWEDANGIGYVFAYNYNPNAPPAAVTLTWYRNLQSVEVLGENRSITPNGAAWTDTFGGASSLKMNGKRIGHIYKLTPAGGCAGGAPSVVFTNPANNATVGGTITVSLSASGGSCTYTNYTVKLDGATIYSGEASSFSWNTTSTSPGPHVLTATVRDSSNVTSAPAQINVTVSQGIVASITSPANGSTVSGTVTVTMSVSGAAAGAKRFRLSIDGGVVFDDPNVIGTTASYSWNTTGLSGSHPLSLTVTDSTTASDSDAITVTVDNGGGGGGPTVDITAPTSGSVVSGTNWVIVWPHNFQGTPMCTVTVGTTQVAQQVCSASPTSIPWDTTAVGNNAYTLTVRITDATPQSGSANVSITVNNTPLTVDITAPTSGATVSGTNWVVVWPHNAQGTPTCTITVGTTQVAQQACGSSPTSIPWNTTAVTDGQYTLTVTITDSTPRTGTASVSIRVANLPLTVDITAPTNGATVSGTNWVVVWPHNFQGTPTCTVKVNTTQVAQQACSASPTSIPWNTTAFGNGQYTLTVTITDATTRVGSAGVTINVGN